MVARGTPSPFWSTTTPDIVAVVVWARAVQPALNKQTQARLGTASSRMRWRKTRDFIVPPVFPRTYNALLDDLIQLACLCSTAGAMRLIHLRGPSGSPLSIHLRITASLSRDRSLVTGMNLESVWFISRKTRIPGIALFTASKLSRLTRLCING